MKKVLWIFFVLLLVSSTAFGANKDNLPVTSGDINLLYERNELLMDANISPTRLYYVYKDGNALAGQVTLHSFADYGGKNFVFAPNVEYLLSLKRIGKINPSL